MNAENATLGLPQLRTGIGVDDIDAPLSDLLNGEGPGRYIVT